MQGRVEGGRELRQTDKETETEKLCDMREKCARRVWCVFEVCVCRLMCVGVCVRVLVLRLWPLLWAFVTCGCVVFASAESVSLPVRGSCPLGHFFVISLEGRVVSCNPLYVVRPWCTSCRSVPCVVCM